MLLRQLEFRVYIFKGVWEGIISLHFLQVKWGRMSQAFQKAGVPWGPKSELVPSQLGDGGREHVGSRILWNHLSETLSHQKLYKDIFVLGVGRIKEY